MLNFLIHRPKWIVVMVGILLFCLTQSYWLTSFSYWQKAEGILIDGKSLEATVNPQEQPFSEGVEFDRQKKILQVPPGKHQF